MYEIRTAEINNAGTYFLTKNGYLVLVKSLSDELAWIVQRELINNYFKEETGILNTSELSPELQMFNDVAKRISLIQSGFSFINNTS